MMTGFRLVCSKFFKLVTAVTSLWLYYANFLNFLGLMLKGHVIWPFLTIAFDIISVGANLANVAMCIYRFEEHSPVLEYYPDVLKPGILLILYPHKALEYAWLFLTNNASDEMIAVACPLDVFKAVVCKATQCVLHLYIIMVGVWTRDIVSDVQFVTSLLPIAISVAMCAWSFVCFETHFIWPDSKMFYGAELSLFLLKFCEFFLSVLFVTILFFMKYIYFSLIVVSFAVFLGFPDMTIQRNLISMKDVITSKSNSESPKENKQIQRILLCVFFLGLLEYMITRLIISM